MNILIKSGLIPILLALTALGLGCEETDPVTAPPAPDAGPQMSDDDGPGDQMAREGTPYPASLKRLRTWEYHASVRALLGDTIEFPIALRSDLVRASFSSISATLDCQEAVGLEAYETIALDAAAQAFAADPSPLAAVDCAPASIEDACLQTFLATFGHRAFRRPLDDEELNTYLALTRRLNDVFEGDLVKATELTVAAFLQSPYFLYRVELGQPTETASERRKYTPHEMATRLSFVLWGTPPDDALLAAADAGELATAASVRAHAERLLADPRAEESLARFWREHLNIDRLTLTNFPKSDSTYPQATADLYAAMRAEGRAMARQLVQPGANALDFLTYGEAVVEAPLAEHYGMPAPPEEGAARALPADRRGYLTSGLFLTTMAHPDKTSPTRRGKFVLERFLCQPIAPPPPNVDVSLPEVPEGEATRRDLLEAHATDPACAGCHIQMDPIGYALEGFDGIGQVRGMDNGLPIDSTGTLDGVPFEDATSMIDILAANERLPGCVTRQTMRFVMGQLESPAQQPYLDALTADFVASNHEYRTLIVNVVASDAFRFARGQVGEDALEAVNQLDVPYEE